MKSKIPFIILLVCLLFVASCKEDKYCSVSTSISPDNSGIVYPESGIYEKGTTITLTAEPSEGYIFVGWGGDASGNDNPMIVDVHSDMDIIALFNLKSYPLSITMVGEGVVNEEVISSKSDYGHGTLVELTAMPAEGWSFSHWEGDIESDANPYQIEINSTTSVKAVFEKRVFSFSVKTVGPGCVDEYLIETKAQFEYGTKIRLEVIPFNGAVFKGWSGAVSGIETSKIVDIHSSEEIVATFSWEVSKYPIPEDLRIPSVMLKRFYSDTFTSKLCTFSGNILTFDYNQDGYPDVVTSFENGELLSPIRFYLGQEDGTIIPDPINDRKILGLDECRKLIYGDYNGDGKPDICIISHGIDVFPFPGDYPMVLLSQEDGSFKDVRFPEYIGYYHGGTAGDFDNDGDVDILFSDSSDRNNIILVNDGEGNFTPTFGLFPSVYEKFTAEWYDIDKDGYLDLIWSLPGEVIWGNGISFVDNESSLLPPYDNDCNLMLDFDFYDIDGDGTEEIISCATDPYYTCYGIQILSRKGRHFEDVTNKFIPEELAYIKNMGQIIWIRMEECKDGTYLVGRLDSMDSIEQTKKLFKLENGSLVPFEKENPYTESFPIFTEWKEDYNYSESENADAHCQDNPYMGSYCIRLDNWYEFESQCFSLPKIDLTKFVENGYCLEFAMKNSDPLLELGLVFVDSKGEDHGYQITEDEKKSDGQWHIYTIPLNQFGKDDHYDYDIWKEINFFKAVVADYHGKEIYLDEIRIRKVVR